MIMEYKKDIKYYYVSMSESGLFLISSVYGISKKCFWSHFPNIYEDSNSCKNAVFNLNIFFNKHIIK